MGTYNQNNQKSDEIKIMTNSRKIYVTDFRFNLPPILKHLFQSNYKLKESVEVIPGMTINTWIDTRFMKNFEKEMGKHLEGNSYEDWSTVEILDFNQKTGYCEVRINSKTPLKMRDSREFIKNYFSSLENSLNQQLEKSVGK